MSAHREQVRIKRAWGIKMRNKGLKIVSTLLCAVFFCLLTSSVGYAISPLELRMESVTAADGILQIYCNSNSVIMPEKTDFTAILGNTVLTVRDVTAFEETDTGASYIFLVDVSGSIKQSQFQAIKDTIVSICGELTDKDNISIFAIGDEAYTQPFVSDPDDIQSQIDAIERSHEDTNLYESVIVSLSILNTHENCCEKKTLVIFSDGEDDILQGITIDEAAIEIKDSHIPIYTVAMLGINPDSRYVESAKVLGSFARLSAGGRHYLHTLDETASEEISADIISSIRQSMVVSVDLTGFHSNGDDMVLRLDLTVSGIGTASDGYAISTAGLSAPSADPSQAPVISTSIPDPIPSEEIIMPPESIPGEDTLPPEPNTFFRIIYVAAALLLAGIVIFIVLRCKKPADQPSAAIIPEPVPVMEPVRSPLLPPPPGMPKIALWLTKTGRVEKQVFHAEFVGQLIIGRDASKATLPFKDDDLLSSRHCSISYEPEGIILRDLGSTNGTFVNGLPIQEWHILENDDILLIGSMELRINWEPSGI